jgi:hypothetical protein
MMPISLVVGAALLLLGRRLFWVFVLGVGFVFGARLATEFFQMEEGMVWLVAVLVAGILGAMMAWLAKKVVVVVAGFMAGGYLAHVVVLGWLPDLMPGIAFVVGGVVGAILLVVLFDWALIVISSLTGAAVIMEVLPLTAPWPVVAFFGLVLVGFWVQSRGLGRKDKDASRDREG